MKKFQARTFFCTKKQNETNDEPKKIPSKQAKSRNRHGSLHFGRKNPTTMLFREESFYNVSDNDTSSNSNAEDLEKDRPQKT